MGLSIHRHSSRFLDFFYHSPFWHCLRWQIASTDLLNNVDVYKRILFQNILYNLSQFIWVSVTFKSIITFIRISLSWLHLNTSYASLFVAEKRKNYFFVLFLDCLSIQGMLWPWIWYWMYFIKVVVYPYIILYMQVSLQSSLPVGTMNLS